MGKKKEAVSIKVNIHTFPVFIKESLNYDFVGLVKINVLCIMLSIFLQRKETQNNN